MSAYLCAMHKKNSARAHHDHQPNGMQYKCIKLYQVYRQYYGMLLCNLHPVHCKSFPVWSKLYYNMLLMTITISRPSLQLLCPKAVMLWVLCPSSRWRTRSLHKIMVFSSAGLQSIAGTTNVLDRIVWLTYLWVLTFHIQVVYLVMTRIYAVSKILWCCLEVAHMTWSLQLCFCFISHKLLLSYLITGFSLAVFNQADSFI